MQKALRDSVRTTRAPSSRAVVNGLITRELCARNGELTPFGRVTAISLLPLAEQCSILGFSLEELRLSWRDRPEPAVLEHLLDGDLWGFANEGKMVHALIHALVLPRLYAVMSAAWNREAGYDAARSWLYGGYAGYNDILDVEPDLASMMLADIRRFDKAAFVKAWRKIRRWNIETPWLPHPARDVKANEAVQTLEAIGRNRLTAIATRIF